MRTLMITLVIAILGTMSAQAQGIPTTGAKKKRISACLNAKGHAVGSFDFVSVNEKLGQIRGPNNAAPSKTLSDDFMDCKLADVKAYRWQYYNRSVRK